MKSTFSGDFLGFTYNGIHSSSLGIVRTNTNSGEQLLPQMNDVTSVVSRTKGSLYYGTTYTQRNLTITFAFERLTEDDIRKIKILFNDNGIHKLIYDETPYKSYRAKANGSAIVKHLCFSNGAERYYNGEGTINFICYFPYAVSEFSFLDENQQAADWALASDIPEEGLCGVIKGNKFNIYNAGDTDCLIGMLLDLTQIKQLEGRENDTHLTLEIKYKTPSSQEQSQFSLVHLPLLKTYVYVDFYRGTIVGYNESNGQRINEELYLTYASGDLIYIEPKEFVEFDLSGTSGYFDYNNDGKWVGNSNSFTDFSEFIKIEVQYLYI